MTNVYHLTLYTVKHPLLTKLHGHKVYCLHHNNIVLMLLFKPTEAKQMTNQQEDNKSHFSHIPNTTHGVCSVCVYVCV